MIRRGMALVASAAGLLALAATYTPKTIVAPPLQVETSVQPSASDPYQLLRRPTPRTYTCSARVLEAGTEHMLDVVKLIVARGDRQTATRSSNGLRTTFRVSVTSNGERADTEVVVARGGEVLTRQVTSMSLILPSEKIVPAQ
jgi:hypothetical protein